LEVALAARLGELLDELVWGYVVSTMYHYDVKIKVALLKMLLCQSISGSYTRQTSLNRFSAVYIWLAVPE
jgi:hypothetical protein